mgnify:CR=1 FL=1
MQGRQLLEHMMHLIRERDHLKTLLQPQDTGHINTAISVLDKRIIEIKGQIGDRLDVNITQPVKRMDR